MMIGVVSLRRKNQMIDLKQYEERKRAIEKMQRERDRAEAALEHQMGLLKNEFKCDSLEVAKIKAGKMEETLKKKISEYEEKAEEFDNKWGNVLDI